MIEGAHITPLLHNVSGRQRVVIALNWDARATKTTFLDKLKGTNQQHDLDLSCFVYDKSGAYIDMVGAMAQEAMDSTGCIYHSGDDATGEGDTDDEFISCELAGLPATTHSLIFVAEIRSNHVFSDIEQPRWHIADGMTNKTLFDGTIAADAAPADGKACVLARIFRDRTSPTYWSLETIGQYPALEEVSGWGAYLTRYL